MTICLQINAKLRRSVSALPPPPPATPFRILITMSIRNRKYKNSSLTLRRTFAYCSGICVTIVVCTSRLAVFSSACPHLLLSIIAAPRALAGSSSLFSLSEKEVHSRKNRFVHFALAVRVSTTSYACPKFVSGVVLLQCACGHGHEICKVQKALIVFGKYT